MTAVTEGREWAKTKPQPRGPAPVPEHQSDQASLGPTPATVALGSDSNEQQAMPESKPRPVTPAATNGQGQAKASSQLRPVTPAPAYHELRVFAELYADVQQTRIACANRAERGGLDPMVLASQLAGLKDSEHQLGLALVRCYRRVVPASIRAWQQATPGIGEHLLARLLGTIGDPRHATPHHWEGEGPERALIADEPFERNVAKLWAYCGHGDPSRKRRRGMTAEDGAALGNPRAKMLVHLLAEAGMKCVGSDAIPHPKSGVGARPTRARSPYRDTYEQARERYAERIDDDGEPWIPAHQHAAALRVVGKEILRDLWLAAGDRARLETQTASVPGGQTPSDDRRTGAAGDQSKTDANAVSVPGGPCRSETHTDTAAGEQNP